MKELTVTSSYSLTNNDPDFMLPLFEMFERPPKQLFILFGAILNSRPLDTVDARIWTVTKDRHCSGGA
jgi:hypothetical protein